MAGTVVKPATEVKHRRDQIRRPDHTLRVLRTLLLATSPGTVIKTW